MRMRLKKAGESNCLTAVRQLRCPGRIVAPPVTQMVYASHIDPRVDAWRGCVTCFLGYTVFDNTRQGYARESTLKPAGYLFLGM